MNEIKHILGMAGKRLFLIDLLKTFAITLFVAIVLMVAARITQKLVPVVEIPWMMSFGIGAGVAFVSACIWSFLRRPNELMVAQEVDERADLRESLSTALCVDQSNDAWSKTIVSDAANKAKRVELRSALPISAPRLWPMPFAAGLVLLAVWYLPTTDVTGLLAKQQTLQAEQAQIREVQASVNDINQKMEAIAKSVEMDLESLGDEAAEDLLNPTQSEMVDPDEMVRATLKKLTKLNDQLDEKRNDEEGATFDAIRDAMRNLSSPEPGAASEMGRAMARGDFKDAKKQLNKLADQIQDGSMSETEKAQASKALEGMKKQLESMAANNQQLEEQLKSAGMSEAQAKQLSGDPEAMKKALEKLDTLSQEQIEQLAKAAASQQNASDAANAMAQAMGQMAQGMQQGNMPQAGEGLEKMDGQLGNMEQMQSEAQALDQAMSQAQQQMDELAQCSGNGQGQGQTFGEGSQWGQAGEFSEGESMNQRGSGSGGPGQGMGASPNAQAVDYTIKKEHANVNTTDDGPVISSTFVNGEQIKGESTAAFSDATSSAAATASEAIETKRVPHEHEAAIKRYFGRLEKAAKEASGEKTEAAESGADAGEQKDAPEKSDE